MHQDSWTKGSEMKLNLNHNDRDEIETNSELNWNS